MEDEVRVRDKKCIYCGIDLVDCVPRGRSRKNAMTWEHIINDARIITRENIALCCSSCNSSKGVKPLAEWISSRYCLEHGINKYTVAEIVRKFFENSDEKGTVPKTGTDRLK